MTTDITEETRTDVTGTIENSSRYPVYLPKLPVLWSYQRFGEILDVQGGSQPPKSQFIYERKDGYVQLLQIRDFGERSVPTFVRESAVSKRCREDDILVARYGASLGRIVTGKAGAYNVALAKVIYDKKSFYGRYLFYLLQTPFFQTPIHMISRSAQNGFNKGDLSDILLPVAPLDEQREIVAEIEKQFTRLEAGVAGLRSVQVKLKRYRAAVLKAACEGKLVPTEAELARERKKVAAASRRCSLEENQSRDGSATQEDLGYETGAQLLERILTERREKWNGKGKYKEPIKLKAESFPELPEGWTGCFTDCLFFFVTSGSRGWARYYSDDGPVFLRIGNLDHGSIRLDLEDVQHVNPPIGAEGTRTKVAEGDLLVSITADVGMIAIAPAGLGEAYINQHVALARPINGFNRNYLGWYLAAEHCGQKEFLRLQRGATKAGLGLDDIRSVPVPLPPFIEQQRIVAEVDRRLSVVEELEGVVNANLQRATRLRQSILQRAFEGNLLRDEQENLSGKAHDLPFAAESAASYGRAK